jgi:hypothetical protein
MRRMFSYEWMIVQVLIIIPAQIFIGSLALGGQITMTNAEQQVGGMVGWAMWEEDHPVDEDWDPESPQGLGNANLNVSVGYEGLSTTASLASVLLDDEVMVGGASNTSAHWTLKPLEATDVHGASGARFALYFTRGPSAAYFRVFGEIGVEMDGYDWIGPLENYVHVILSTDDGMTTVWEELLYGADIATWIPVGHGVWLEEGKTYLMEAYAQTATHTENSEPQLRTAWFSLTAGISQSLPIEATVDIVEDTITTKTKWTTCNISLPENCNVADINPDNILLNGTIPGVRPSINRKQEKLVVKFPVSELNLEPSPDPYELTVSGELTDGTPFAGADDVKMVERGGGKK